MGDFRSDTVTQPTLAMKQAMSDAPLGDDVYGDDPTVNRLQDMAAEMLGFEASLFAPSGTQTNLIALMGHCQRGEEAIVGQQWHTYRWEAGGMAVLGSIQPQPLENQPDGTIALDDIASAIKPDDPHFARTRLIVLENTTGGKVLPLAYMRDVQMLAKKYGLRSHIDGARLMNAAVSIATENSSDPIKEAKNICNSYDSVSLCLSKGLGAPIGSLLFGSSSFVAQAKRTRKMLGGGMRQAGILAAAGIYALENNVQRLTDDHANASMLSNGLKEIIRTHARLNESSTVVHPAHTNILFMDVASDVASVFLPYLAENNIRVTSGIQKSKDGPVRRIRWVTHLNVNQSDVERALTVVARF